MVMHNLYSWKHHAQWGSEEARETLQEHDSSILVMKMIFQLKSPMPPVMLA